MADPNQSEEQTPAEPAEEKPRRPVNWIAVGVIIAVALVIAAGVYGANWLVEDQRARNIQVWQNRLEIVAHSRKAAIDEWIEQNFATLRELTANASSSST